MAFPSVHPRSQDPRFPVDIGCGTLLPIRASNFAAVLKYDHDPARAPCAVEDKPFEFHCIVLTTGGHWQFHGAAGKAEIDAACLMAGVAGDSYGCRHYRGCCDSNLVVALREGALDPDSPRLFGKQIVPSQAARGLVKRASQSTTDDALDSLAFTLFDDVSAASQGHCASHRPSVRMQRAKRFIELHAFEPIGLDDIARELGLSPFSTLRQFRAATGKTPYAYLLELRLARARQLLTRTASPVRSIALETGFEDPAYFSRFFRKSTGCSPSMYRAYHC